MVLSITWLFLIPVVALTSTEQTTTLQSTTSVTNNPTETESSFGNNSFVSNAEKLGVRNGPLNDEESPNTHLSTELFVEETKHTDSPLTSNSSHTEESKKEDSEDPETDPLTSDVLTVSELVSTREGTTIQYTIFEGEMTTNRYGSTKLDEDIRQRFGKTDPNFKTSTPMASEPSLTSTPRHVADDSTFAPELTETDVESDPSSRFALDADEVSSLEVGSSNVTRGPKKIQQNDAIGGYPEVRVRPARPDPGYVDHPDSDFARPYRPDAPLHKFSYFRPTPETRIPVRSDQTKTSRSPVTRASFKPFRRTSTTSSEEQPSSRTYRPSFNSQYIPQGSFGRPYHPDYQRPSSKTTPEDTSSTKPDLYEHSRSDYESTRHDTSRNYGVKTNVDNKAKTSWPYRPFYDEAVRTKDFTSDSYSGHKGSRPDTETTRPMTLYTHYGSKPVATETPFASATITSHENLTRVDYIRGDCYDNYMKVTLRFNGSFEGLVYSSGYAHDHTCNYVNGSGRNSYEFPIRLNRCGTLGQQDVSEYGIGTLSKRGEGAQYLVNTVTVQYNPLIEEDSDEHIRVTCEYGYDFWKTVTFPVINVESGGGRSSEARYKTHSPAVFTLAPPQCNMEVRAGHGPAGARVTGPVSVGDPITLVIHMKSESNGFDILVSNCVAHNGGSQRLQLIDSNGCVTQEKLVTAFRGAASPDRNRQVTLYSYLKAFRFTGSPALYLECDVHMCHGSCPSQRCYWRHLNKRSAEKQDAVEAPPNGESLISDSVSLFQALEVRHEEVDSQLLTTAGRKWEHDADTVCMRTSGFAALGACAILLLLASLSACACVFNRQRKLKGYLDDARGFVHRAH